MGEDTGKELEKNQKKRPFDKAQGSLFQKIGKSNKELDERSLATIAWLLESPTPSIRYLTLTRILGKAETDAEVQTARQLISSSNPVLNILNKQQPEGYWQYQKHYYSPKYRASHWSMLLLSELGIDPQHEAMQKGATFMLDCFESDKRLRTREETFWGCLWGNALRYQLYCQMGADERVQGIQDFVVRDLQNLSRCRYNNDLPCAWGVIRDLFGLALIPEDQRDTQTKAAIQTGLKFLLEDYDLLQANYPYIEKIHPLWSSLSFPLFYHADVLFVLRVAKELNALDYPQARKGMQWLQGKRHKDGTWSGGSPFHKRTWPVLAKGDSLKRWISLYAMSVLS
jgi:hypothetical protein